MPLDFSRIDTSGLVPEEEENPLRKPAPTVDESGSELDPGTTVEQEPLSAKGTFIEGTRDRKPEEQARLNKISRETGLPTRAIEGGPSMLEQALKVKKIDFDKLKADNPRTSEFLNNPDNAAVAQDDVEGLATTEDLLKLAPLLGGVKDDAAAKVVDSLFDFSRSVAAGGVLLGGGVSRGVGSTIHATKDLFSEGLKSTHYTIARGMDRVLPESFDPYLYDMGETPEWLKVANKYDPAKQFFSKTGESLETIGKGWEMLGGEVNTLGQFVMPSDPNLFEESLGVLGQMGGQILALSYGGSAKAGMMFFTQGAGEMSAIQGEETRGDPLRDASILAGGAFVSQIEKLPLQRFLDRTPIGDAIYKRAVKTLLDDKAPSWMKHAARWVVDLTGAAAYETIQEGGQQVGMETLKKITTTPDHDVLEGLVEQLAPVPGGAAMLRGIINIAGGRRSAGVAVMQDAVGEREGSAAEQRTLEELNGRFNDMRLKQLDPEAFREAIRGLDNEEGTHVYIDPAQASMYLQDKTADEIEADPALRMLSEKVDKSRRTGAMVSVPIEDFATDISGTDHYTALRSSMTLRPDSTPPIRQAQEHQERISYARRLIEEAQRNDEEFAQAQEIFRSVSEQLVDSGRYSREEAGFLAQVVPAWATVMSKDTGMPIQEIHDNYVAKAIGPQSGEAASAAQREIDFRQQPRVALDDATPPPWGTLPPVPESTPRVSLKPRQDDAVSVLAVHHSDREGLTELDPTQAGMGRAGAERRRFGMGNYGRWGGTKARTYFYIQDREDRTPRPEGVFRESNRYRAVLDNMYDATTDPRGFREQAGINPDKFEELISKAGFDGFVLHKPENMPSDVAVVFDVPGNIPVESANDMPGEVFFQQKPLETAQRNGIGLYSAVEYATLNMNLPNWKKGGAAKAKEILPKLKKMENVKQEEIDEIGLTDLFESNPERRFTRGEVLEFVRNNGVVVEEVIGSQPVDEDFEPFEQVDRGVLDDPRAYEHLVEDLIEQYDEFEDYVGNTDLMVWLEDWIDANQETFIDSFYPMFDAETQATIDSMESDDDRVRHVKAHGDDYLDDVHGMARDDFLEDAHFIARREYLEDPMIYMEFEIADADRSSVFIRGDDDTGYMILQDNVFGEALTGDPVYSEAEAMIQLREIVEDYYGVTREDDPNVARWEDYITPGGYDNYRELKLTLPEIQDDFYEEAHFPDRNIVAFLRLTDRTLIPEAGVSEAELEAEVAATIQEQAPPVEEVDLTGNEPPDTLYLIRQEMFWKDIKASEDRGHKGMVLNASINWPKFDQEKRERVYKQGRAAYLKREMNLQRDAKAQTYFIDEFQSDWHQEGRQKGYTGDVLGTFRVAPHPTKEGAFRVVDEGDDIPVTIEGVNEWSSEESAVAAIKRTQSQVGVADAPFKGNNWISLGLKRALVDAVEKDMDALAWADSEALVDRWSDRYRKLYETQYDTKMPSIVKKLTGIKPIRKFMDGADWEPADISHLNEQLEKLNTQEAEVEARLLEAYVGAGGAAEDSDTQVMAWLNQRSEAAEDIRNELAQQLTDIARAREQIKAEKSRAGREPGYWIIPLTDDLKRQIKDKSFPLFQGESQPRGYYDPVNNIIRMTEASDLSTFLHEFAHFALEMETRIPGAGKRLGAINDWFLTNTESLAKEANGYLKEDEPSFFQEGTSPGDPETNYRKRSEFFSGVVKGEIQQPLGDVPYTPVIQQAQARESFLADYTPHLGNFDEHIAKSIPGFADLQVVVGDSITKLYGEGARMLDIGSSEGNLGKTITKQSGVETVNLDPNPDMRDSFEAGEEVPGATHVLEAFVPAEQQGQYLFDEKGHDIYGYKPETPFDIVHEAMTFQFIDNNRATHVKAVSEMLADDGIAIFEEKFSAGRDKDAWKRNEELKTNYKRRYFAEDQITEKDRKIVEGMHDDMVPAEQFEHILRNNFEHSVQFWSAGNFKGYVAGNDRAAIDRFLEQVGDTGSEFSTEATPRPAPLRQDQMPPGEVDGPVTEDDVVSYLADGTTGDKVKDAALRRATHEQFARAFEAYLMEGKAPTPELQSAFRRFARWLREIYRNIANLNVNLDNDIRAVFDRILATEEQIEVAQGRHQVEAMFTDAALAGMTEAEFEAYRAKVQDSEDKAVESLRTKLVRQLHRQTKSWWKEQKQSYIDEETDRLSNTRLYTAIRRLRGGDMKLDLGEVRTRVGEDRVDALGRRGRHIPAKLRGMTRSGGEGVNVDEAAVFLGYDSGAQMLTEIMSAPPLKEAADIAAEQRMIAEHGDILNDGTIEAEADLAVQNETRAEVLLTELRTLARQAQRPAIDKATIQEAAVDAIGRMTYREIQPHKYRKAEVRAAQESAVAFEQGDKAGALAAKSRQVMNFYLGREATKARQAIEKVPEFMARYSKRAVRAEITKAENGYLGQIDKILKRFEFRKSTSMVQVDRENEAIQSWMERRFEEEGDAFVLTPEILDETFATHWKKVPYSALMGVKDSVKNIEHVARYANKIERLHEEMDFRQLVDRWVTHINQRPAKFKQDRLSDVKKRNHARWAMAGMTKVGWMTRWLDGGDMAGMSHDILFQPFTDAMDQELQLWKEVAAPVMEAIRGRSKEDMKRHNTKLYIPAINDTHGGELMGHQVLAVALNTGNQGNLKKMLLGEGWATADDETTISKDNPKLQAVLRHMTKSDWDLVQLIWDQMDKLYPMLAEVHRDTTGLAPTKVEATPVETPYGTYSGGYYPVKYSPARSFRAEENQLRLDAETESMFSGLSLSAQATTGAVHERTKYHAPIQLGLSVVQNHFSETIHYITHHKPVREVNRLLRNEEVATAIKTRLGPDEYAELRPWLNDIAKNGRETKIKVFWEEWLDKLRLGVTLGIMGFKGSTGIIQTAGLTATAAEVGAARVVRSIRMLSSPERFKGAMSFATENSKVLPHRMRTLDREIYHAMREIEGKGTWSAKAQEVSMKHIAYIQTYMVDLPSWHAAYAKRFEETGDEQQAFTYADKVVESVQGSGLTKDMAKIMRNQSPTNRMFTMFMTWFSSFWNQLRTTTTEGAEGLSSPSSTAAKLGMLVVLPVIFEMILRGELFEDEDDDGDLELQYERMLLEVMLFPTQSVPFVRDATGTLLGGFRHEMSPIGQVIRGGVESIPELVTRPFTDEEITKGQAKGASRFAGAVLGIPGVSQAWATGEHLHDVMMEGEKLTLRQLIYGPKRED